MSASKKVGFIGKRFAGLDGVTLESAKWATVLQEKQYQCFWFAGENQYAPHFGHEMPEAHFSHPLIHSLHQSVFSTSGDSKTLRKQIEDIANEIEKALFRFIDVFQIDYLIPQNLLCLPMNLPFTLAASRVIQETQIPTIAHHHDFYWERNRFETCNTPDLLENYFPIDLPCMHHIVINSIARDTLYSKKQINSTIIPNVFDFSQPPNESEPKQDQFRKALDISPETFIFLQPTRVVPRKGIELAIECLSQLNHLPTCLLVTHASGDEGQAYRLQMESLAKEKKVDLRFIDSRIGDLNSKGEAAFSLANAYHASDFVTYPSLYEGFGNALLESIYYGKPTLVNRYRIFKDDIEPLGFQFVTINESIEPKILEEIEILLKDTTYRSSVVKHNYQLASIHFGFDTLRSKLIPLLESF